MTDAFDGFAVLLVDDHPLFRDGLANVLHLQAPGLKVRAVASLTQALRELAQDRDGFDLVLLDYRLPGADGLRSARRLRESYPQLAVGLLSGVEEPTLAQRARSAGLVTCLPKSLELSELLSRPRRLAGGETVFDDAPAATELLADSHASFGLSDRQFDVLRQLATGATNKDIAQALSISPSTVKSHLEAIFTKTGTANRLQAVTAGLHRVRTAGCTMTPSPG